MKGVCPLALETNKGESISKGTLQERVVRTSTFLWRKVRDRKDALPEVFADVELHRCIVLEKMSFGKAELFLELSILAVVETFPEISWTVSPSRRAR